MRPLVMGVLNVTPDSFSDGGAWGDPQAAVHQGRRLLAEGADIVDVGGESTRPGADPVGIDTELARVVRSGGYVATAWKVGDDSARRGGESLGLGIGFDIWWLSQGELTRRFEEAGFAVAFWGGRPADPVEQLRSRSLVIAHGSDDRVTRPAGSRLLAERAHAAAARVCRFELRGDGHSMLRRPRTWHRLARRTVLGGLGLEPLDPQLERAFAAPFPACCEVPL